MEVRHGKVNTNCFEFTRNEVDMSLTRDRLGMVTLCNYLTKHTEIFLTKMSLILSQQASQLAPLLTRAPH